MLVFPVGERRFLLQLEHGEELKEQLRGFAADHTVGAAVLSGLGAADRCELDFYHLPEQRHERVPVDQPTEIASLVGTITRGEADEPVVHVHAALSRADGSTLGGHLKALVVGATLEVDLEVLPRTVRRTMDSRVGLPLLHSVE